MAGFPIVDRVTEVLRLARGRRVLHLGCTNWPYTEVALREGTLLHSRLAAVAGELVGVDSDPDGVVALEQLGLGPVLVGDVEHLDRLADDPLIAPGFDLVVAAEIIEHVDNPGVMLRGIDPLLRPDGRLVVTTINAYGAVRIAPFALRGRGGELEPVHPDHVAYYSPATMRLLLERNGYTTESTAFYGLGAEHRAHAAWWIRVANDVATRLSRQLSDGIVVVARRSGQPAS